MEIELRKEVFERSEPLSGLDKKIQQELNKNVKPLIESLKECSSIRKMVQTLLKKENFPNQEYFTGPIIINGSEIKIRYGFEEDYQTIAYLR